MLENFFSNAKTDDLLKLLSLFITMISTYFVTKYTSNNPRKREIKQKQLENVYLPIYKLIRHDIEKNITKNTAIKYAIKINSILLNNFELVFPQLHILNDQFLLSIKSDDDYQTIFNKISYQINLDYFLLMKSLGYPSQNSFTIFLRMNRKDKLIFIFSWVNVLYIMSIPFTFGIYITPFNKQVILKLIIYYLLAGAILVNFNREIGKIKS